MLFSFISHVNKYKSYEIISNQQFNEYITKIGYVPLRSEIHKGRWVKHHVPFSK